MTKRHLIGLFMIVAGYILLQYAALLWVIG